MRLSRGGRSALALAVAGLGLAGCSDLPLPSFAPAERHAARPVAVDEAATAAWITAYRRSHGLSPVAVDPALQRVAQAQADAMATANQLSHTVAGTLPHRLGPIAAVRHAYIENVSAGYASMASALAGWQHSPGHDANLLFAPMRRVGIAAASAPDTRYGTFWSLVMTD
jgi:uncharacterized protein YkwD